MGYGYVFTNAMLIMAAVMLLRDFPKNKKGIAQFFMSTSFAAQAIFSWIPFYSG